jgi:hypothetical protein
MSCICAEKMQEFLVCYFELFEHYLMNWDLAEMCELDLSILRHSGIWGAADEAVLNKVMEKFEKIPLYTV